MQEAIAKLKTEINSNKSNPHVQVVGEFLIRHLVSNPQDADKILVADKTIVKSLEAMKAEAKKKQHNGMAMLTDAEGFTAVLKYYGISGAVAAPSVSPVAVTSKAADNPNAWDFDVKLDDYL